MKTKKNSPVSPHRKDAVLKGMTIIEVLIAVSIFVIGIEGFTMLFMKTWKNNSYTLEMGRSSLLVSQGLNKIANYIRGTRQADNGSYPVKSADGNDLVLYSDYNKDGITERLHFYKSGQNIFMGVTSPGSAMPKTYPLGDEETFLVAGSIINTASEPIFSYYNSSFAGDEAAEPPLATPASVSKIRIIKIHLKININPNRAPDNIEMQSFVEMRNLSDYDRVQ